MSRDHNLYSNVSVLIGSFGGVLWGETLTWYETPDVGNGPADYAERGNE